MSDAGARPVSPPTRNEEIASALTHGVGAGLSIAGLVVLVVRAVTNGGAARIVSSTVFGATLVALYVASTLYHSANHARWKRILQVIDHMAIYLLIAGTYTPFMLVSLRGGWGWSLFGVIWGLATAGVILKSFLTGRYEPAFVAGYIVMGSLMLIAIHPLSRAIPAAGIAWLVGGGVSYVGGVAFYAWQRLPYNHAIWHLFVMAGSICHYFCILWYVIPKS